MEQGTVRTHRRQFCSALVPFKSETFSGEFLGHFAHRQKGFKGTNCQVHNNWAGFEQLVGLSHEHTARVLTQTPDRQQGLRPAGEAG